MNNKGLSSDAFEWAFREFIANDPKRLASYQEERIKAEIAQRAYDLRNEAGISQVKLAQLVGVTESEIDDLEEGDYDGDALLLLGRIGAGLRGELDVGSIESKDNGIEDARIND
jgi:DNA-binding XRE family transcriptional regulator